MIIELNSVGSVLDTQTNNVYPQYNDTARKLYGKDYDEDCGVHLSDTCEDWLIDLSEEDTATIRIYYPNIINLKAQWKR